MTGLSTIIERASLTILSDMPDPIVEFRLRRDVLLEPNTTTRQTSLRQALELHPRVRHLLGEQREDGSWGGLHCGKPPGFDTRNTETAVEEAIACGLEAGHPALRKTAGYLTDLLAGRQPYPEGEKNDRSAPGWRMFAASCLSWIDPDAPALDGPWETWSELVGRTFADGEYDSGRENEAQRDLQGVQSDIRYLHLRNKYAVALLGSRANRLPKEVEKSYARWLWSQDRGLGYLDVRVSDPPIGRTPGAVDRWLTSHQLLSLYPTSRSLNSEIVTWLMGQVNERGLWNLGPRDRESPHFPLSGYSRARAAQEHDWSIRVLTLLSRYAL